MPRRVRPNSYEMVRAAAEKLRETADGASYQDGRWVVDVAGPAASTAWLGPSHDVLTATWRQAAWVAAVRPDVAGPLAAMLDIIADRWIPDRDVRHYAVRKEFQDAALAFAEALLDGGDHG